MRDEPSVGESSGQVVDSVADDHGRAGPCQRRRPSARPPQYGPRLAGEPGLPRHLEPLDRPLRCRDGGVELVDPA